jgi:hypothetical protein
MLEMAVNRIVFKLIREIFRVGGYIHDGDDVDRLAEQTLVGDRLKHQPADSAETIDTNL